MKTQNITILGSTGSIGTQALDVVRNLDNVKVKCLSANKNITLLKKQIEEFKPEVVCVMDKKSYTDLKVDYKGKSINIVTGIEGLLHICTYEPVTLVINSLVGNIGLKPTISAIQAGKNIALANKETLVSSGQLIMNLVKEKNVQLYPIDSEHSAIWQCLQGSNSNRLSKIILTASGGPFRTKTLSELKKVSVQDALKHPNWKMGNKITIDSASLMNKGLEVIEAKWLFNLHLSQIDVIVHPQSIVHSMIEYEDGSIIAQLGEHDMRLPIQYALTYPNRVQNSYPKIDFLKYNTITFEEPRWEDFPCLNLAYKALTIGGTMPAVLNAANEVVVEKFLNKEISFLDIPILIEECMQRYNVKQNYNIEDIFFADAWARKFIKEMR